MSIEFDVFNPSQRTVELTLVVQHAGTDLNPTAGTKTRIERPLTLKPGKTDVKLDLASWTNNDGSVPDLGNVKRWYIALPEGGPVTLYFGDIWLTGGR